MAPLVNDEDYEKYIKEITLVLGREGELNPEETAYLRVLAVLIEDYEKQHYPIENLAVNLEPKDAVIFRLEQLNLRKKDLVGIIGNQNRVYEVLNGKRKLSLTMIKNLHKQLDIPYENLLGR